jgi:hypothetical protein
MVLVPNWITTFSDLVAPVSIMNWRAFSLRPSSMPSAVVATYLHDPETVAKIQSQFSARPMHNL